VCYESIGYLRCCNSGAFNWAIHFWLGSESSQDEYGIAAYKTVELDESLGGAPVQYREVQGNESPLFLSYFRDIGLEYLPGMMDIVEDARVLTSLCTQEA
jgi:hypothetical protein